MEKKSEKRRSRPFFHIDLKVKLTTLLLLTCMFNLQASTYAQKNRVTLNVNNVAIEKVIERIQQTTDFRFIYNVNDIDLARTVSISVKEKPVDFVLSQLFSGTGTSFKISDNQIILKKIDVPVNSGWSMLPYPIKGKIVDENGVPLPGATVMDQKTKASAMTDLDGNFELTVETESSIVVVTFIGYENFSFTAGQQPPVIKLKAEVNSLNEVVVVGYGTAKRRDVTGAIGSIQEKDMNKGAITDPLQLIAGKLPGVSVTQTGSEPGTRPSIRIRGVSSLIGGADPLVVVDGIQGDLDFLNTIPPSEIASIDVLKDASATAIYGSRGAPGVLIVTLKKGKAGKTTIEFNATGSFDQIPKKLDMMNADEWWAEAQRVGVPASANHGANTDWYDIMTQNGYTQNYNLSFGGGTDKFSYRAAITAILQEGIVINSNNKRYIGTFQATQKGLDDKLRLTFNMNSGISNTNRMVQTIGRAAFTSNLISQAYVMRPTDPVFNTDGTYFTDPNLFQYLNPYAVAETTIGEGENDNFLGSLKAELDLLPGLTASWFGSWRKTNSMEGFYIPVESTDANAINQKGFANVWNRKQNERLMDMSLTYTKNFGRHTVNLLGLYEWQSQVYTGTYAQARGFINDLTAYHALQLGDASASLPGDVASYKNDRRAISFLGRVNYGFGDRYLLTASLRRDGSTVFGANHKWGNFPAASVAWQVHNESFMKDVKFINEFKIRGGYGETGNQQGLTPLNSIGLVGPYGQTYFGGEPILNFGRNQNPNPDLKWEVKKQTNLGFDFAMFDNRFRGSFDVYRSRTDDLLLTYEVSVNQFEYQFLKTNGGSMENKGLELALAYDIVKTENTRVTLAGNMSLLKNKILSLDATVNGLALNTDYVSWGLNSYLIEGQPLGTFNILHHTGVDDNGKETVLDADGSGPIIDQGNDSPDKFFKGSVLPTYTFSFNPTIQYKNVDFSMLWRGSGGNKIYNGLRATLSYEENIGKSNLLQSAAQDRIYTSPYSSDYWLEDGSFIRLENMTFGYNINFGDFKYLEALRITLVTNNLALFTKYKGLDPELNFSGSQGGGNDNGIYPRTRTVALGLNLKIR
ncbi:TonB-dependent receptor [Flavobacterium silvaticum]|uniref:TonB-dependent receptor n=1 Tax=Flavobacterium silvaticum TaxID=1852020 RepID=A0A972JHV6_9FLAO|nr:TonB-dependent receptor [Flavobacterium silvaticum]NMH27538.1 TonB-dependent receptor [Flavobacterium silvaticum]